MSGWDARELRSSAIRVSNESRTALGDNFKPATRTILQVDMRSAIEANDIFTLLMGDKVEPRRKFIEENALEVQPGCLER